MRKLKNWNQIIYALSLLVFGMFPFGNSHELFAQLDQKSLDEYPALKQAISFYEAEQGRNSLIYTGRGYYDPHDGVKGHQYFIEDYWEIGNVTYDQSFHDSIYLKYDIYSDVLLVENFNSQGFLSPIELFAESVQEFQIYGQNFIRLEKDSISGLKEGYYNLMFNAEGLQVLVKRRKEIIQSNDINSLRKEFTQKDRYYIMKDGIYHRVRKKNSILKVLQDRKKALKRYIRQNHLLFRANPDLEIVQVANYYNSLI